MGPYGYRRSLLFSLIVLSVNCPAIHGSVSWFPYQYVQQQSNRQFEQKTDRFWEYDEQAKRWTEVELPRDLVSCVDGNCTKLSLIQLGSRRGEEEPREIVEVALPQRKRMSLTKMSETSIWVTGESGSIYERFWNGAQWVVAPHDLPVSAGRATSVFFVNQTILALSEAGQLHQLQLIGESSQPVWVELPTIDLSSNIEKGQGAAIQLKSGFISHDRTKAYFCTKKGLLLELVEVEPSRWVNHGHPPGANVAEIAGAATLSSEVIFTISSTGELYEFDRSSRPSWKKHIRGDGKAEEGTSLMISRGHSLPGSNGYNSFSLFLLTKRGDLIERRLHQWKWRWIVHGSPEDHNLSSITSVQQDELVENFYSLFFTTTMGTILEYRKSKLSEMSDNHIPENWVNHMHPKDARAARSIAGVQIQMGRILFPLDDGRLGELHVSGLGGETSGPGQSIRKKPVTRYLWSILDAPETEGWNAEYCTEERGPTNCINGIKDDSMESSVLTRTVIRRKQPSQMQQEYLLPGTSGSDDTEHVLPRDWTGTNFRLRVMYGGRSFFLIADSGVTFEYLYSENVWFWLRHDHSTAVRGAIGNYNGSLFVVDTYGSLIMRERTGNALRWINCTAMKKAKQVIGGPPWDGIPGREVMFMVEDAIFLVSNDGSLLQFTVSQRKFKWKDCQNPMNTKVASIVDQEQFRNNVVFVVGRNGRLYQYNKVTALWHEHSQSHHLVLSMSPGTAMRPSTASLAGSIFMLSKDGGLVEYRWSAVEGWNWVEHGTPGKGVTLVGSPGPCFPGSQLFLIGSDGSVYLRYMDQAMWKWENLGYPLTDHTVFRDEMRTEVRHGKDETCVNGDFDAAAEREQEELRAAGGNCHPKVAATRPIPFSEDSVIFELRDGRLAEMQKTENAYWIWSRTIGTPTSLCQENYWAALEM